jgi:hypothetical protein
LVDSGLQQVRRKASIVTTLRQSDLDFPSTSDEESPLKVLVLRLD